MGRRSDSIDLGGLDFGIRTTSALLQHDCLFFSINVLQIENVYNFNFLGLTINCHLDWKSHLNSILIKIAREIGLLRKLKYTLPTQVLRSIYNSLILPHMHYVLLA